MNERKRLARLVGVKRRMRDAERSELANARKAAVMAQRHAKHADAALSQAMARLTSGGSMSGDELARRASEVEIADGTLRRARTMEAEEITERDRRRDVVVDAHRDLRTLETLKEKADRRALKRTQRIEQGHTDEAAARAAGGKT